VRPRRYRIDARANTQKPTTLLPPRTRRISLLRPGRTAPSWRRVRAIGRRDLKAHLRRPTQLALTPQQRTGRAGEDLIFGRTATEPFFASTVRARSLKAWGWKQTEEDGHRTWVKARDGAL
jgi:hypothetical protein